MTIERRTHPNRRYPRGRYPIVVALALLLITGVVVFLFIIGQEAPKHEPCSPPDAMKGGLSIGGVTESAAAFGAPLAFFSETPSPVVEATLSDDLDHDGKPDGMADPLGVLLGALVVFATRFVLLLLVPPTSGFLLKLGEPGVLVGSDHQPALERPG